MYVRCRWLNGCTDFDQIWYMHHLDTRKKNYGSKKPKGRFFTHRFNIKINKPLESSFSAICPLNINSY